MKHATFYYSATNGKSSKNGVDSASSAADQTIRLGHHATSMISSYKTKAAHGIIRTTRRQLECRRNNQRHRRDKTAFRLPAVWRKSEELNPNFTTYTGTDYQWNYRFTGRELDPETGLQLNRNRFYHQQLAGGWLSRDPIGYEGGINLYAAYFVPNGVDPLGEECAVVNGVTYVPGRGRFGKSYVLKSFGGGVRSDFSTSWTANADAFKGEGDACCCCTEIGFAQVVRETQIRAGYKWTVDWKVDTDVPYPFGTTGDPCGGSNKISMTDTQGYGKRASFSSHT